MTSTDLSRIAADIRTMSFSVRRRGFDEEEVLTYLAGLADSVSQLEQENATLRSDLAAARQAGEKKSAGNGAISAQAVIMFAEAQKVADSLIDEAVTHARDLMMTARVQQRDIVKKAHDSAEAAVREVDAHAATAEARAAEDHGSAGSAYDKPVPEIEYVRTFAKVAQIQLRSVLEALTEQVDALGEMPNLDRDERGRRDDPRRDGTDDA